MDANTEADSRPRSSRCDRERPATDSEILPSLESEPTGFLPTFESAPTGFLPIFLLGDTDTSGAAPVPESSTCSITASSSSSSSATWILVELPRGSGAGAGGGAFPHARMNIDKSQSPVSFPCRSLSTFWNTALSRSRSRHAGDRDLRFSSSTTAATVARMRSSSAETNRRTHRSGSSCHDLIESPVHGACVLGSRSRPRTSATMCSCGGSLEMALSRSYSLRWDPSSRDWRMDASFSCAGPMAGRFRPAREAEPDEA